ncbi:MAG: TGS domain-containing protein [archaeon]|nr:TGS domain-containing protein [archaeon]MCP8316200.1 TGS domain-containing protein [archaeon]MCP8320951.1 TGS domain-containing protein [archaeon]
MVTNLTEKAKAKWAEAIATRDPATKLRLLKEFYSSFPKHKGTEKMEMSIKRQISSLEEELERAKARRKGSLRLEWVVKKGELIQLAIVGTFQTAISFFNLLARLDIKPHEALMRPILGVFKEFNVQFQLIFAPFDRGISDEKLERFMSLSRNADGILIALGHEPLSYVKDVIDWFESHNIDIRSDYPKVEIVSTPSGGIRIVGSSNLCNDKDIIDFLSSYRIKNAIIKITRDSNLDDVESALFGRIVKKAIFISFRRDQIDQLKALTPNIIIFDSSIRPDIFASYILERLGFIRIYTKGIGEEPERKPLIMKTGTKVIDVAEKIHKDLVRFFQYARVWRKDELDGVRVGKSFELMDGDMIEIRTRLGVS